MGEPEATLVQTSDFRGREVLSEIGIFRQLTKKMLAID